MLSHLAPPLADAITQSVVAQVLQSFTNWVASGATWILAQVIGLVQQNTAVNLDGAWFQQHYATMIALGVMVMLPMLLAAAVKSALTGNPTLVLRAAFVYLPMAIIGTFAASHVVNLLLAIVDEASQAMSATLNSDYQAFANNVSTALTAGNPNSIVAPFVIFICAILIVVCGLLVFVELLFRNGAVYATAVFIPLALATIVFPSTSRIAKRLLETLVGLILLKFFIVAVLSVGVAALGSQSSGGTFATALGGIVVLLLAAVLPNLLIGLLPLAEGAAVATIASRTTLNQAVAVAPSSNQIYSQIRRNNEARLTGAGGAGFSAGVPFAGGDVGISLVGASPRAPAGGGVARVGLSGAPTGPGPGGVAPVKGGGSGGGIFPTSTQSGGGGVALSMGGGKPAGRAAGGHGSL